ncbi:hypothetical protein M407DRAFT_246343 [Tulasnella calospora MUT 4182]|uniref:Uncharacterized protein n=1 Tax=Tulasnella calospora MUT 4182 TaxID=1051891 RepID=A0A0C3LBT0_9AGAM|nr:hypothetical protein M407DRAFT_246343 [Tulasnella calospora MUT 4182]
MDESEGRGEDDTKTTRMNERKKRDFEGRWVMVKWASGRLDLSTRVDDRCPEETITSGISALLRSGTKHPESI